MNRLRKLFAGISVMCALCACASDVFTAMDGDNSSLKYEFFQIPQKEWSAALPLAATAQRDGFAVFALDGKFDLRRQPAAAELDSEIRLIGTPGDYYTANAGFYTLKPGAFTLNVPALKNTASGTEIPAKNIKVQQMLSSALQQFDMAPENTMLVTPKLAQVPADALVGLTLFVDIPADAAPGIYEGALAISGARATQEIPIRLRVMDFRLPELPQSAGFYLPGHFDVEAKGILEPFGTPDWKRERLDHYMNFMRSRRLNSIALYHNYADLRFVDGKVQAKFPDLSYFAAAMKKAGLNGYLVVELRHMIYWSQAVAAKLRSLNGKAPSGDLGVTPDQGWASESYPADVAPIFEQILAQLLVTAAKEEWPRLLIAPEEEMSNTPRKTAGYDSFIGTIKKLCPEQAVTIDNELGYNRKNEIDRGRRDGIRNRQYNNWPEYAWENALAEKANVMTFNYDPDRISFGFMQYRMKSVLNHQWADYWKFSPQSWQYSMMTGKGITTSVKMENIHMGRLDLAACMLLERKIAELRSAGKTAAADEAQAVLDSTGADLPTNGYVYRNYLANLIDRDARERFWRTLVAIEKADCLLTNRPVAVGKAAAGAPRLSASAVTGKKIDTETPLLSLPLANSEPEADGMNHETYWSKGTGMLGYTGEQERKLRAYCSTAEEFKRYVPSYTQTWMSYSAKGLLIYAEVNHQTASGKYRYERKSDDPDLWQDDVMEFFFRLPEQQGVNYQLIVNSAGAKTFNANMKCVPSKEIGIVTRSPRNAGGGTAWEILIPWRYFNLSAMPAAGSVWQCNIGREFHTYHQVLSWGKVDNSFHEYNRWGNLVFSGNAASSSFAELALPQLYPGNNVIAGVMAADAPGVTLEIQRPDGTAAAKIAATGGKKFALRFRIPDTAVETDWVLLAKTADGKVLERLKLSILPLPETVKVDHGTASVIGGDLAGFSVEVRYPENQTAKSIRCVAEASDGERLTLPEVPVKKIGAYQLHVDTAGMKPGAWKLYFFVPEAGGADRAAATPLTILPAPWQK